MTTVDEHRQILSCGTQICRTVAQLIHQVPDTRLVQAVVRDLVYLSKDLSLWYVFTSTNKKGNRDIPELRVSLLEETIHTVDWSDAKPQEYVIDIPNTQHAIRALQWHTLSILHHLVVIRQQQRLVPYAISSIVEDYDDHFISRGGDADLYLIHFLDANELRVLFLSLRQLLLTALSSDSISDIISWCHVRHVATRLLVLLQCDWHRSVVQSISLLQEAALMVGYSVQHCLTLELKIRLALPTASWLMDELNGTLENVAQLLSTLIYSPPNVTGSMPCCDVTGRIHRLLWPVLCESILGIAVNGSSADQRCSLGVVLLRTVYAISRGFRSDSCTPPPNTDVIQHLLYLSNDSQYVDVVLFILSYLLFHSTNQRSILLDLEDVVKLSDSTRTLMQEDYTSSSTEAIGVKRKLPFAAYNPEKRLKKNNGESTFTRASFSYFDELVSFFDAAQEGISRLISFRQQRHEGSNDSNFGKDSSFDQILADVALVTSRLGLVLLLVEKQNMVSNFPFAPFLCRYITDSFISISTVVEVCLKEYPIEHNDHTIRRLVELLFVCAIYIENAMYLEGSALFDLRGICRSIKILAKGWNIATVPDDGLVLGLPFRFPASVHDAAYGFALKSVPHSELEWTRIPPIADVKIMGVSVTININNIRGFTVIWTGPILKRMDSDITVQWDRLDLLSTATSSVLSQAETKQEIERRSLVAIRDSYEKHSNPLHRLLFWQTCAWVVTSMTPHDIRQSFGSRNADSISGPNVLRILLEIALSDPESFVHEYASRELGNVLSSNDWTSLFALLASEAEWQQLKSAESDFVNSAERAKEVVDQILCRFFDIVDDIVHALLSKSEVQPSERKVDGSSNNDTFRRSAARALCSLCLNRNSIIGEGTYIVQHALIRVFHLWTDFDNVQYSGLCLAEMSLLSHLADMGLKLRDEYLPNTAPFLFHAILMPKSYSREGIPLRTAEKMPTCVRERQFNHISAFIRATKLNGCSDDDPPQVLLANESDLEKIFESWLPFIVSHFVADMNHVALQFAMSYRLYLRGQNRSDCRHHTRSAPLSHQNDLTCGYFVGDLSKSVPSRYWSRDLDNVTREFCLEPGLVERVIPLIFKKSSLDGMNFFMKKVLQGKISIEQLVKSREMFTLKYFVLEFGRDPGNMESVVAAMKRAAVIRLNETSEVDIQSFFEDDTISSRDAVGHWIAAHFMYLLVNVVQSKWTAKPFAQQVSSLRCLLPVLDYLPSSESSQYLPQVLATVNAALSDSPSFVVSIQDDALLAQRRLLAVHILSKFVRVIAETQLDFLGQNLTSIVVSLVPILSMAQSAQESTGLERAYQRHGVALLEWLSGKEVLLSYFAEIPFLPSTSSLDTLRASLRSRGINFDDLHTVPTQGTQDAFLRAVSSDYGSTDGDSRGAAVDASRQAALRHRLEIICPLLENESVSIRRVVLQHIVALLRANRELFHALVENEGTTLWKQFLTVTYGEKNGALLSTSFLVCVSRSMSNFLSCCFVGCPRWNVTHFIELLLSRCTKENDPETHTLLATCFGEIGAINANRFDDIETHYRSHARHVTDPPWHSAPHQFQLQLVTSYLVTSLKAAHATSDQHKIAFTIQQLLDLLNQAGNEGLLSSSFDGGSQQGNSKSKISPHPNSDILQKPRMNESLIRRLKEAQALDVVEPFWISDFHEVFHTPLLYRSSKCVALTICPLQSLVKYGRLEALVPKLPRFFVTRRLSMIGFQLGVVIWFIALMALERLHGQRCFIVVALL
jgi:hypothetical protein